MALSISLDTLAILGIHCYEFDLSGNKIGFYIWQNKVEEAYILKNCSTIFSLDLFPYGLQRVLSYILVASGSPFDAFYYLPIASHSTSNNSGSGGRAIAIVVKLKPWLNSY